MTTRASFAFCFALLAATSAASAQSGFFQTPNPLAPLCDISDGPCHMWDYDKQCFDDCVSDTDTFADCVNSALSAGRTDYVMIRLDCLNEVEYSDAGRQCIEACPLFPDGEGTLEEENSWDFGPGIHPGW